MKPVKIPRNDVRRRAAALRSKSGRVGKRAPALPKPSTVAAAIEIDALSINTLSHLYDVASLIGEVTCAIGCQPRCLHLNEFGEETANEVGRFVEWHRALCGELQDRISARLFDMAATAQREGAAELLDDVNEALHTRS